MIFLTSGLSNRLTVFTFYSSSGSRILSLGSSRMIGLKFRYGVEALEMPSIKGDSILMGFLFLDGPRSSLSII